MDPTLQAVLYTAIGGVIVALISLASAISVAIINGRYRLKTNDRIDTLESEVKGLKEENCSQKKRIVQLETRIRGLVALVVDWWNGFEINALHAKKNGVELPYKPQKPDKDLVDVE